MAGFGSRTQGMPVSIGFIYYNDVPPPPTGLVGLRRRQDRPSRVERRRRRRRPLRGLAVHRRRHLRASWTTCRSESYEDYAGHNGTTYYYKVRTVDSEGYAGRCHRHVSATPNPPATPSPPSVPSLLTPTADPEQPTVHLTWPASIDGGTPATGLAATPSSAAQRHRPLDDPAERLRGHLLRRHHRRLVDADWYYRVQAVDLVGNASDQRHRRPGDDRASIVYRDITVTNNSAADVYVWVQNAALLSVVRHDAELPSRPASGRGSRRAAAPSPGRACRAASTTSTTPLHVPVAEHLPQETRQRERRARRTSGRVPVMRGDDMTMRSVHAMSRRATRAWRRRPARHDAGRAAGRGHDDQRGHQRDDHCSAGWRSPGRTPIP